MVELESYHYIGIEIFICLIFSFLLLFYYARKNTNPIVLIIAYFSWSLNFILLILLPFDIYYTQTAQMEGESSKSREMPELTEKIINFFYGFIYWTVFILSWTLIPLMIEYEKSGEFTKLRKLKDSAYRNIKYYLILLAITILIIIYLLIKLGKKFFGFLKNVKNCTLLIGIIIFFLLLSYSLIKFPKTLYDKFNYKKSKLYLEFRANHFYDKLIDTKLSIIEKIEILKATVENFKEMDSKNELDDNYFDKEKNNKKDKNNNNNLNESLNDLNANEIKNYINNITENYKNLRNSALDYGISLDKEKFEVQDPITDIKNIIIFNRELNKKKLENLRYQCRIRNCYNRWAKINSTFFFQNNNENIVNSDNIKEEKGENLINKYDYNLKEEGFRPLDGFNKFKIIYYSKIKRFFLFALFIISIIAGVITIICEILLSLKLSFFNTISKNVHNIFVLHFIILIPFLYLIGMSIYSLTKIKISGYIYMYGPRQTDSVSLMYFTEYLGTIYFSICLNCVQAINHFNQDENEPTLFEKFFGIEQFDRDNDLFLKISRFCPYLLLLFIALFYFNVIGKIANKFGFTIFEFESEERDKAIKEGHRYLMVLNKKLDGKILEYKDIKIFEDR